jgi:hypothetical protein
MRYNIIIISRFMKAYMEQRFDRIEHEMMAIKEKIGLSI